MMRSLLKALRDLFVIRRFADAGRTVYLTFDDGPCAINTHRIVDALQQLGVRAAFFFNGDAALQHTELVTRIQEQGHLVGNHSFCHSRFGWLQPFQELASVVKGGRTISSLTGRRCIAFRPPFGNLRPLTMLFLLFSRVPIVMWSIDSRDFEATGVAQIMAALRQTCAGDILLFHGDCPVTALHITAIVREIRKLGFEFGDLGAALQHSCSYPASAGPPPRGVHP